MKLNDLDPRHTAIKALKENFSLDFETKGLNRSQTISMLRKVSTLVKETRLHKDFHKSESNPTYLKMLFLEQALTDHLRYAPEPKIVVENEEVEKSQVILAAQDMVDSVQKWYEEVNDMMVKELPALVDSIESEIGVNESTSFSEAAGGALQALNSALQEAQSALKGAVGSLTGQGGADAFAAPDMEQGADMSAELSSTEMPAEEPEEELPPPPDEEALGGNVGREKR
jgi:hypothetical protein